MESFLVNAGLSQLVERFLAEELTLDVLLQANDAELHLLTKTITEKIKLRSAIEKIKQQNIPTIPTSGGSMTVALPERQNILILEPEGSLEGTPLEIIPVQATPSCATPVQATPAYTTPVQVTPPDNTTNQPGSFEPTTKELSFSLEESEFDIFNDIVSPLEDNGESQLESLLKKQTKGKLLIEKAKKGESLTSRDRCYIVTVVVEAELQQLQKLNQTIRKQVWEKWSHEISTLFKGESKDLYYTPYHIVDGKVIQASGLIHNRLTTHRRSLTPETSKKRKFDSDSSDSGCSSKSSDPGDKRVRPLPENFKEQTDVNAEEALEWLRGSSSPPDILKNKWRATFDLRVKILKEYSYVEYFNSFPGLKLPNGYELLTADFDALYPKANNTYEEKFPLVKLKLLKLLADRAESNKSDQTILDLLELASVGEQQANLAAFLGIVSLLRQMHTVNIPKKKLWRLSREETRNGFLGRVATAAQIVTYTVQREVFNQAKGIPVQPYILAVGPSWSTIHTYEIVTTAGGLRYQVPTICAAVKIIYNIYWALDCAYPKVATPCWMFIQRAIFKMSSKYDVEGVPLRELLSQLN